MRGCARCSCRRRRTCNVGGRLARTQFQYTLQDARRRRAERSGRRRCSTSSRRCPSCADLASDQQTIGATSTLTIDRDQAARFGIEPQLIDDTLYDAFGQRQVAAVLHPAQQLPRRAGGRARAADLARRRWSRSTSTRRRPASRCRSATLVSWTTAPSTALVDQPSGSVPVGDPVVQPRARASRSARRRRRSSAPRPSSACRATLIGTFQGNAQAFQASLASEPYLVAAALIVIYIILGVLYESYVHPLTILSTLPSAGLGALATLMLFGFDFSRDRADRRHPADRHREEERHHAGRLRHRGASASAGSPAREAIREACLLRFRPILMTTMAALLGGRAADARRRHRLGAAPAAGLRHRRRPAGQPGCSPSTPRR